MTTSLTDLAIKVAITDVVYRACSAVQKGARDHESNHEAHERRDARRVSAGTEEVTPHCARER